MRTLGDSTGGLQRGIAQPPDPGTAFKTKLAHNDAGKVLAVWSQIDAGTISLFANAFENGAWGTPELLSEGGTASDFDVASDGTGFAVVWCQDPFGCWARVSSGTEWESATPLGGALGLSLASNGSGYAVVSTYGDSDIIANFYRNGSWGDTWPVPIDNSSGTIGARPRITSDGINYLAAWEQDNALAANVATCNASGCSWGTATKVGGSGVGEFTLVGKASGYLAAWTSGPKVEGALFTGGSWGTPAQIDTSASADCVEISAATNGETYLVAYRCDRVRASEYDGTSWTKSAVGDYGARLPKVASGGAGYAMVFRDASDLKGARLSGGTWSTPALVVEGPTAVGAFVPTSFGLTFGTTDFVTAWPQLDPSSTTAFRIYAKSDF